MVDQKVFDNHLSNFIHVGSLVFKSCINIVLCGPGHITRTLTNYLPVKFNFF
jgi:hypothetical protein